MMQYPNSRNRILRNHEAIRNMMAETTLSVSNLMAPLFITEGKNIKEEIQSMPGYYRYSLDQLGVELKELYTVGIRMVLLFVKVPDELKDNAGKEAVNPKGLMQRSVQFIKAAYPDMIVMTDVALDPYSVYGHDGIVEENRIVNDKTVEILCQMALSHIEAGADWVAPSDMMDGRIGAMRELLNSKGKDQSGILAYSAKYASNLYGPFRDALDSAPGFGDKKTYQMDFRNRKEAIKEALMDQNEGADMLMVKPGIFYLDIIRELSEHCQLPIAAYQVSGEYAMIRAAGMKGWIDEQTVMMESVYALRRAGAQLIISYFAKTIAQLLSKS